MARVKFYLEKRNDKDGNLISHNVPIILNYSFNGKRLQYYTGERIDAIHTVAKIRNSSKALPSVPEWGGELKLPLKPHLPNASTINENLKTLALKVATIHSNGKALGINLTPNYFKTILDKEFKGKEIEQPVVKAVLVYEALEEYLLHNEKYNAPATCKKIVTTKNHLNDCFGKETFETFGFETIDNDFVEAFRDFLVRQGFLNNTVMKYLFVFRTFILWCKKVKKYYSGDITISGQGNDIEVIFLNKTEVEHLNSCPMPSESLEKVKDVFVFGCYTGMRYQDIFNLKKANIKEGKSKDGKTKHFIQFYVIKDGKTVSQTVPLVTHSKIILDKYAGLAGEKALPVISNQKMNDFIKVVMKVAGFTEDVSIAEKHGNGRIVEKVYKRYDLIGCHTSRKSFVTVALTLGMEEAVIKSITGHSKNSRAFTKYYHIVDELKDEAMEVFEKKEERKPFLRAV